jgi:hypothetical protein
MTADEDRAVEMLEEMRRADPDFDADEAEMARRYPTVGESLIHYVMDLEALVRWLALTFSYEDAVTGEVVVSDPIWTVWDERGTHLPAAEKLQETWNKVMHDE